MRGRDACETVLLLLLLRAAAARPLQCPYRYDFDTGIHSNSMLFSPHKKVKNAWIAPF